MARARQPGIPGGLPCDILSSVPAPFRGPRLLGPEAAGVRMQAGLHSSCRGLQKTRPLFLIIMPLRGLGLRTERDPAGKRRCLQVSLWLRGRARPSPEQEAVAAVGPEGGATRPAPPAPKHEGHKPSKRFGGQRGPGEGSSPRPRPHWTHLPRCPRAERGKTAGLPPLLAGRQGSRDGAEGPGKARAGGWGGRMVVG